MSYNGSGTFQINTAGQPVVDGTVISSTVFNALTGDLATGLTTALTKDGQTTPTGNIPMGTFKITGLGAGTAATDAVRMSQLQGGTTTFLTATGTDTITATASPALTAYATGNMFSFVVANTNTGAVTLNVDSAGAKAITRDGTTALAANDLVATELVIVVYDGTRFQVINPNAATNYRVSGTLGVTGATTLSNTLGVNGATTLSNTLGVNGATSLSNTLGVNGATTLSSTLGVTGTANFTAAINEAAYADVASATTTDLGAVASNNVRITGTTTITGLGSGAAGITRRVRFQGALTLTYNATSLILQTSASITTAADDMAVFTSLGSSNWICVSYIRKSGASLSGGTSPFKQQVYATYATYASTSTAIPFDDTIPQITEGAQTVTATITPTSATSVLRITCTFFGSGNAAGVNFMTGALFRDSTASAKAATIVGLQNAGFMGVGTLLFQESAASTSATTYRLRVGPNSGDTTYINGNSAGRVLGGVAGHVMSIEEMDP